MVKTFKLGGMEHMATQSACMVAQHAIKIPVFGLFAFLQPPRRQKPQWPLVSKLIPCAQNCVQMLMIIAIPQVS